MSKLISHTAPTHAWSSTSPRWVTPWKSLALLVPSTALHVPLPVCTAKLPQHAAPWPGTLVLSTRLRYCPYQPVPGGSHWQPALGFPTEIVRIALCMYRYTYMRQRCQLEPLLMRLSKVSISVVKAAPLPCGLREVCIKPCYGSHNIFGTQLQPSCGTLVCSTQSNHLTASVRGVDS